MTYTYQFTAHVQPFQLAPHPTSGWQSTRWLTR